MRNPFQYGKIAEKENFIDRDIDRLFLKQSLASGTNVILISPRRWGKSSLVKQAMSELMQIDSGVRVCYIDAYPIISSSEFYHIFAREVLRATSSQTQQVFDMAGRFLRSIMPKISFSPDRMSEFSLSFDFSGNQQDEEEVLNLPERIAVEQGIRVIVCIDEFQKLAKLSDYERLENRMRSVWQHQQHTAYCLYGSQRHMMDDIFNSPEKPFYRFGQMYPLRKIAKTDWVRYIIERFDTTDKQISNSLAERITEDVECHSWYVQQLSSAVWNMTDKVVTEEDYQKAFDWCIDMNCEAYHTISDRLTEPQIGLLRAVANGEKQLSSASNIKKYRLGSSANVVKNKKLLSDLDVIVSEGGSFSFLDPMFRVWFIRNYM